MALKAMRRRTWRVAIPQKEPAARICLLTSILPLEASGGRKGGILWRTYEGTRRGERREHGHGCET